MRSKRWYQLRLQEYYNDHYGEYDDEVQWYTDPAPNKWKFIVPKLNYTIVLTCGDNGHVFEDRSVNKF